MTFASLPSKTAHSIHIMNMCQSIAKLGTKVILIADLQAETEDIFEHYDIKHRFILENIRLKKIRYIGRLIALFRMYFMVKNIDPEILYTRDLFNGWLAGLTGISFIFELHEIPVNGVRSFLLRRILCRQQLKKLVFISKRMRSIFQGQYSMAGDKSCIAHDGVTLDNFKGKESKEIIRKKIGLPVDGFIAGYTGSLFPGRGLEILFALAERFPGILFVIVGGEGKYLEGLKTHIDRFSVNNLLSVGSVPYRAIPDYLKSFDVLLMPYQNQVLHRQAKHDTVQYMSPLKMFEYMAAGKPIISSRIQVLEEVLQHDVNALLVEPDNIKAWESALNRVKTEDQLAQKIAQRAGQDVAGYTWDRRARFILNK